MMQYLYLFSSPIVPQKCNLKQIHCTVLTSVLFIEPFIYNMAALKIKVMENCCWNGHMCAMGIAALLCACHFITAYNLHLFYKDQTAPSPQSVPDFNHKNSLCTL